MGAMTAAGWMAVASTASSVASAGYAIYQAKHQKAAPSVTNVPTTEQTDEVSQSRDRRRAALGGGMASTILAGNSSSYSSGKSLLGQ